jgi:hypothetical protein
MWSVGRRIDAQVGESGRESAAPADARRSAQFEGQSIRTLIKSNIDSIGHRDQLAFVEIFPANERVADLPIEIWRATKQDAAQASRMYYSDLTGQRQ